MKTSIKYLGIITLTLATFSCSKDDTVPEPDPVQEEPKKDDPQPEDPQPEDPVLEPEISSIRPSSAQRHKTVFILGKNFGEDREKIEVFYNGKQASIQFVKDTLISTVLLPRTFTGQVKVIVDGKEILGPELEYLIKYANVTTFAGSEEGNYNAIGTDARFSTVTDGILDSKGNLFVVDRGNYQIKKITPEGAVVSFAGNQHGHGGFGDGTGDGALFANPYSIAIDGNDNLYVCDNFRVRKITPGAVVTTLAGSTEGKQNGVGEEAKFRRLTGICTDADGNVYVADVYNELIRKIDSKGVVTTYAGSTEGDLDGDSSMAQFNKPSGVSFDSKGNLFVTDEGNNKIKKISPEGIVSTYVGQAGEGFEDGPLETAKFNHPYDIDIGPDDTIYILDYKNNSIRKITPDGMVKTIAGNKQEGDLDGSEDIATFRKPWGLTLGPEEHTLYIFDTGNHRVRKITEE